MILVCKESKKPKWKSVLQLIYIGYIPLKAINTCCYCYFSTIALWINNTMVSSMKIKPGIIIDRNIIFIAIYKCITHRAILDIKEDA